ncbi:MAG TPA: hypothetical protein VFA20_27300 [Myxococcaceae bacterium]|nr:hypothetical protein [Myxococcaceae bacterium]
MRPRIEIAEVVSFRLTVPYSALEQAASDELGELPLSLEQDGADVMLKPADGGDCSLRFAPVGEELVLTEVLICNDEAGAFFSRVLARLLTDHAGDLEAKLVWSQASRNTHGSHAPVVFRKGRAIPQPASAPSAANVLRDAVLAGGDPQGELAGVQAASDQAAAPADEEEIRQLLARAKEHWAEYQRLKSAREEA